ncbi:MAG: flagellar basal body L-ring protein FlgH [Deltaproteobacteria bacterium]|nr:flagellar basal body L-ring protein FlgH [Deltaproteobacteria bacterium]
MFRTTKKIVIILGLAITSGCAVTQPQKQNIAPVAAPVIQTGSFERDIVKRDPESLAGIYNEMGSRDFFQDLRAYKVGDLVTINIVETSSASKTANTQTGRNSSMSAGIDNLLGWEGRLRNLTSFGKNDVRNAYNNTNMLKGSLTNIFDGSGSTSRGDNMKASITARVIDTKPNGNLYIKGTREIRVNSEIQIIVLSGVIRPADISPDNTILSSYIGEAKIEYLGSGPISDKQRPGWLTRAVDTVWPF